MLLRHSVNDIELSQRWIGHYLPAALIVSTVVS